MGMFDAATGDLVTYLKTQSGVTALVGAGTSARIYPDVAKQGVALPHLVFAISGSESFRHLGGDSGMRRSVVQFFAFAATRAGSNVLAEQVRLALANFRGAMGDSYIADCSTSVPMLSGYDEARDASDQAKYWAMTVFDMFHHETVVSNQ